MRFSSSFLAYSLGKLPNSRVISRLNCSSKPGCSELAPGSASKRLAALSRKPPRVEYSIFNTPKIASSFSGEIILLRPENQSLVTFGCSPASLARRWGFRPASSIFRFTIGSICSRVNFISPMLPEPRPFAFGKFPVMPPAPALSQSGPPKHLYSLVNLLFCAP